MAKRSTRRRALADPKTQLPTGLDNVFFRSRLPYAQLKFKALWNDSKGRLGFVRRDETSLRGVLSGGKSFPDFHAHISIRLITARPKKWHVVYSLVAGSIDTPRGIAQLSGYLQSLRKYLREPERMFPGIVGATFELDSTRWNPVIPLPFSSVKEIPGSPSIAGVDFLFPGGSDDQLHRAFIAVYPESEELRVRFLVRRSMKLDGKLPQELIGEASQRLPIFAQHSRGVQ